MSKDSTADREVGKLALLTSMYFFQGISMGLVSSIPVLLHGVGASYAQLAMFANSRYPYSFKILWAPLIDSIFSRKFGRRRSWIVPTQILIGCLFIFLSSFDAQVPFMEPVNPDSIDAKLGPTPGSSLLERLIQSQSIVALAGLFFFLYMLTSTQDIAVDAWGVTLLSEQNRGHVSSCQSVGLTFGSYFGSNALLALSSVSFCNSYLRSEPSDVPVVPIHSLLMFLGVLSIVVAFYVIVFVPEVHTPEELESFKSLSVSSTYASVVSMFRLRSIRLLVAVFFTRNVFFSVYDNVAQFRLLDKGLKQEDFALFEAVSVPLSVVLVSFVMSRIKHRRYLDTVFKGYMVNLCLAIVGYFLVVSMPDFSKASAPDAQSINTYFYLFSLLSIPYGVTGTVMFVSMFAFFSSVCDERIGGTYLTLLACVSNFGHAWVRFVALRVVEWFTFDSIHGFAILGLPSLLLGFVYLYSIRSVVDELSDFPSSAWKLPLSPNDSSKDK